MYRKGCLLACVVQVLFWPQGGSKAFAHLLIAVPDDGQIEELAAVLFGQD